MPRDGSRRAWTPRSTRFVRASGRRAWTSWSSRASAVERRYAELTAAGTVPLAPASWKVLTEGCEALGVPPPATADAQR